MSNAIDAFAFAFAHRLFVDCIEQRNDVYNELTNVWNMPWLFCSTNLH